MKPLPMVDAAMTCVQSFATRDGCLRWLLTQCCALHALVLARRQRLCCIAGCSVVRSACAHLQQLVLRAERDKGNGQTDEHEEACEDACQPKGELWKCHTGPVEEKCLLHGDQAHDSVGRRP